MKDAIKKFFELEKKDQLIFSLLFMAITNFAIAVIKFILSILLPSLWFFVNAGFGFVLSFCRLNSVKEYRKAKKEYNETLQRTIENKNYLTNGIMLILLGIMYFFVSSYMYFNGTDTTMHEYITYLVALIAFWSIGTAIYGMIRYKRNTEPIIKAVKITNFANALTSIVLTQVVLLDTFAESYNSTINGYTGMGVSFVIMALGLYMILGIKKQMN